jgi:hypothetical protein
MKLTITTKTEVDINDQLLNIEVLENITDATYNEKTNELEASRSTADWIIFQITKQNEVYEELCKVSITPVSDWNKAIRGFEDFEDIPYMVKDFMDYKYPQHKINKNR